jgi:hypothetical protein|nr:MAG TPA: hypothetical protein [Caudoviricetes sp.]
MDNMSLSDIAAVTRGNDNDGWGQSGAWWIIILFLFVFMGGGGLWGNRQGEFGQYATAASQQEILFGQQFGQLNDRLTNIGNGICNLGYEMQGGIGQLGKEVALAQAGTNTTILQTGNGIQAQLAQCCCDNRLATANLAAQMDKQTCAINSNIDAKFAELQKQQYEQTIAAQNQRISQLELASQMYGVVKYPNGYSYNAGPSPFCGCNNGCGNI